MSLFELSELVQVDSYLPKVPQWGLKHAITHAAAEQFLHNNNRVQMLLMQTPSMIASTGLHTEAELKAMFAVLGKEFERSPTKEEEAQINSFFKQYVDRHNAQFHDPQTGEQNDDMAKLLVQQGTERFEYLIDANKDNTGICDGVVALISSALILACSAVDVVCADMCRNIYGLKKIEKKKMNLGSIKGIRQEYELAFNNDVKVMAAIKNPHLTALSQVRHVLVHNAGIVDKEYDKKTKDVKHLLPPLEVGEAFPMNGKIAKDLIRNAILAGKDVVVAVDEWLEKLTPTFR